MAELEDILDQCIDEMRGGRDIEEVLRKHAQFADQLRPLLTLASRLECLPAPVPSMAGMARAMSRFLTEAVFRPRRRRRGWPGLLYQPALARAAAGLVGVRWKVWG